MIAHVVNFKFVDGTSRDHLDQVTTALKALETTIPMLERIIVGVDLGYGGDNFDLSIMAFMQDRDAWQAYQDHPEHQAVAKTLIRPHLSVRAAVQFDWFGPLPPR